MPIQCPCGHVNADESSFCSGCGKKLVFREGPAVCPKCGYHNADSGVYCAECGEDLERGYAKHTPSDEIEEPSFGDAYVKYGNPDSLFFWGGTYMMTKTQYMVRAVIYLTMILVFAVAFAMNGLPWLGLLLFLVGIGSVALWWRIGRSGAGG
jgi:hypothetical protein